MKEVIINYVLIFNFNLKYIHIQLTNLDIGPRSFFLCVHVANSHFIILLLIRPIIHCLQFLLWVCSGLRNNEHRFLNPLVICPDLCKSSGSRPHHSLCTWFSSHSVTFCGLSKAFNLIFTKIRTLIILISLVI